MQFGFVQYMICVCVCVCVWGHINIFSGGPNPLATALGSSNNNNNKNSALSSEIHCNCQSFLIFKERNELEKIIITINVFKAQSLSVFMFLSSENSL